MMGVTKKKAISGFIRPRWPKERVVRWLEAGAVPAVLGLWLPDWVGAYTRGVDLFAPPVWLAFPPVLTYAGALILLKACYEGIKNMGYHFKGLVVSGGICVLSALLSVLFQFLGFRPAALVFIGLGAFFAAGFFWFTIGKVWEITQEARTKVTWHFVWVLSLLALGAYLSGAALNSPLLLRAGVGLFTADFLFCRYGVHCYKTQTSIGARFKDNPDDQFWTSAG
jgi:hypothetical protein